MQMWIVLCRRRLVLACSVAAVVQLPVLAHHSISAVYDSSRLVTIDGVVSQFHLVNPHPYLVAESGAGSLTQVWRLELDNRFELVQIGMTADTFAQGDRLLVSGAPGRNRKTILYVRELDRPADGFRYEQPSSTPRIVRPAQGNRSQGNK